MEVLFGRRENSLRARGVHFCLRKKSKQDPTCILEQPEQETDRLQQLIGLLVGGAASCMSTLTPLTPSSIYPANRSLPAQLSHLPDWEQQFLLFFFGTSVAVFF